VANKDPRCEVVDMPIPMSLVDEESTDEDIEADLSQLVLNVRARLARKAAFRLTLPIIVTWSDSDGEEIWRQRMSGSGVEFKIEDEFVEASKLGIAVVAAANGEAPLFVIFTDEGKGELRFRIQFGDYPLQ